MSVGDPRPDAPTAFDRAVEITPLRLIFYLTLVTACTAAIFSDPRNGGTTPDWQFFQYFDEIARRTILHYHQFPLWNPYGCGGTTLIGNPQTTYLVPTFPLVLWFGTTFGERLSDIVVIVACCEGGYRLMKQLGVTGAAALLGSVAYPLFGRTFSWIAEGQYANPGCCLIMWILYCYLRGLSRPVYLAVGGAFFAWMLSFRGIAMGPQVAIALGLWSLLEARRRLLETRSLRKALWPVLASASIGLFGFGFAAVRLVPVLRTVLAFPRIVNETAFRYLSTIFIEIFVIPPGTPGYGAPGYAYIGVITYLLFIGALLFAAPRRRAAIPIFIGFFFMLVCIGYQGPLCPYPLLKELPLFRSLRNPTHYSIGGALFLVLAGCYSLDELQRWFRRQGSTLRWIGRIVPPVLALVTAVELGARGRFAITQPGWRTFTYPVIPRVTQEFRQTRGNRFPMVIWPYLDRGTLSCYDETPWLASPDLRPDLAAEEYLANPTAGHVERSSWTPNRIELAVDLVRPGTVIVNQNWNFGWHASVGTVRSANGLLAIDLPAGRTALRLRFLPLDVFVGLFLMLLTLGVAAALVRQDRRRQRLPEAAATGDQ